MFGIKLSDLLELNEKTVFNLAGTQNNQSNWHIGSSSPDYLQLKSELEKQQLINGQKDKEIEYLKQINALLNKPD
ncbi:MAG: hypothetical protein Q8N96_15300 [Methylovulum sp.]|nr:hypothetical protein [Methylovulum sp.]